MIDDLFIVLIYVGLALTGFVVARMSSISAYAAVGTVGFLLLLVFHISFDRENLFVDMATEILAVNLGFVMQKFRTRT